MQGFSCPTKKVTSVGADLPCPPAMEQETVASMLQRAAQHACCADVSVCGVRPNGHNRVTEMTSVKSSKVRTMLQCDCNPKSHVIACAVASVHWEASKQAASSGRLCATRNGSPRTQ